MSPTLGVSALRVPAGSGAGGARAAAGGRRTAVPGFLEGAAARQAGGRAGVLLLRVLAMATDRWRLDGQLALVTGGSAGIGLAIVRELLGFGATVLMVARDPEALERARGELADELGEEDAGEDRKRTRLNSSH